MADVKRNALAELIDNTELVNGWTDADVARWATRDGEHKLTTSDISLYRTQGMPTVVPRKIIALADGLRLPAYRVAAAALEDHGIPFPDDALTPEAAIEHDYSLPVEVRELLLGAIERARATKNPRPSRRRRATRADSEL